MEIEMNMESLNINENTDETYKTDTYTTLLINKMEDCDISDEDFQTQLETELFQNNFDVYDKSNENIRKVCLDVPNTFAKERQCVCDDEDYIYGVLSLPIEISNIIINYGKQSVQEYVLNFIIENNININYNEKIYSLDNIYGKVIYIYQFVDYYYTTLKHITPQQRITHLPDNMLLWVDNVITLMKQGFSMNMIKYNGYQNEYINIKEEYFNELLYGLNLCVCHLKMIVNHCHNRHIQMWSMDDKHIEKFFRVLNNLCIIIIFMKMVC